MSVRKTKTQFRHSCQTQATTQVSVSPKRDTWKSGSKVNSELNSSDKFSLSDDAGKELMLLKTRQGEKEGGGLDSGVCVMAFQ